MTETVEQYPWESQIALVAFLGTLASLAAMLGFVSLSVEQIAALSEAAKVPLDADFQALEDLVEAEKAKKEKKVVKVSKKTIK